MIKILLAFCALAVSSLACGSQPPPPALPAASLTPLPTLQTSVFDSHRTAYGFFPSPPEISLESVLHHFDDLGKHADFVLLQPSIPWEDVVGGTAHDSQHLTDLRNQVVLARQNNLEAVFVVDPLNGLNRREFMGLPAGWEPSFGNPDVRAALTHFALWIAHQYQPRYLGLASEINTYGDAHPEDFQHFLSLYREVYQAIQAESPSTNVFVTFQWEDLNNLFPGGTEGRQPYQVNWDQVEAFEPDLDLWVVSTYPFVAFPRGADIPQDYYTPLLSRTGKPLAVAEGGYTSEAAGPFPGSPQDQVDYLNAIHNQLGGRLQFWVYLLLSDFSLESYAEVMRQNGVKDEDVTTLGMFSAVGLQLADGTPKPALAVWDQLRAAR